MGRFEKFANHGTCDVCGKDTDVVVCSSAFGATCYAYCRDCFNNYLEPYGAMVVYISCAGNFPDDINEEYQRLCRHILKGLGISEEKFIEDVKRAQEDYAELNAYLEGKYYDEEDDFC